MGKSWYKAFNEGERAKRHMRPPFAGYLKSARKSGFFHARRAPHPAAERMQMRLFWRSALPCRSDLSQTVCVWGAAAGRRGAHDAWRRVHTKLVPAASRTKSFMRRRLEGCKAPFLPRSGAKYCQRPLSSGSCWLFCFSRLLAGRRSGGGGGHPEDEFALVRITPIRSSVPLEEPD